MLPGVDTSMARPSRIRRSISTRRTCHVASSGTSSPSANRLVKAMKSMEPRSSVEGTRSSCRCVPSGITLSGSMPSHQGSSELLLGRRRRGLGARRFDEAPTMSSGCAPCALPVSKAPGSTCPARGRDTAALAVPERDTPRRRCRGLPRSWVSNPASAHLPRDIMTT